MPIRNWFHQITSALKSEVTKLFCPLDLKLNCYLKTWPDYLTYWLRWEISGFCLLSFCQNERFLSFLSLYIFEESVFIFQFLNDKIHNYVLFDIIVHFIIQKLKNKHTLLKNIQTEKTEEPLILTVWEETKTTNFAPMYSIVKVNNVKLNFITENWKFK